MKKKYNNEREFIKQMNREKKLKKQAAKRKKKERFSQLLRGELLMADGLFYCPICKQVIFEHDHFKTIFQSTRMLWLANMITHIRHTHIKYWNKWWSNDEDPGYGELITKKWDTDYDTEKRKINERAKRHLIRTCTEFLKNKGISVHQFEQLVYTDFHTLELARRKL